MEARKQAAEIQGRTLRQDARRKILVGAAILAEVERRESPQDPLLALLDASLTRADDPPCSTCPPAPAWPPHNRPSLKPTVGRCPHPAFATWQGCRDGLRPGAPHPTTGTSAATVQHRGFGFAQSSPVRTRCARSLSFSGWP
ncbi:hypothetical protein [Pseudomonas veronii]